MTVRGARPRLGRALGPVALVVLSVSCGGNDDDEAAPSARTSTSVVHETAQLVPAPGPSTSELMRGSPSLQIPVADPGSLTVVTWGRVSDGAVVAVVRNMAKERATAVAVAAKRPGETVPVGPPGVVLPTVLNPGEWGMALVVLDGPAPARLEFETTTVPGPRTDLAVQSAEGRDGGVAGTVGNPTARLVKDVVVDVVCFSGSRPSTMARLRPAAMLEPGATASFSAPIRGTPCSTWAVVASGSAEQ